jgi:hypothetical protein
MASTPYATAVSQGSQPDIIPVMILIFAMSAVAAADELTDWIPGFNFEIIGLQHVTVTAITTGGKTATLTPYIDAVAVPGCSITVAGAKAKGVVTYGNAPTSKVYGTATSKIKLTGSAVTAFTEGAGYWILLLRNVGNNA